jgi:CheY-like chemotaxis protein
MVVDHEAKTGTLLRSVATPLGYAIFTFDDYEAAGRQGETQRFESIFVGMQSPGLNALELIHRIRHSEPNRTTFVVALSETEDISGLRNAFCEGADMFLIKPLSGDRLQRMLASFSEWKDKRQAVRLPLVTEVSCTWDGHEFPVRSLNVSETGMLLQPAPEVEIGEEVKLAFKIPETRAFLDVTARIVRKEETDRVGVEFVGLAPEDINAIQVYILGRMKDRSRSVREFLSDNGPRKPYAPFRDS